MADGSGWDISASRAVRLCVFCWWKRARARLGKMPSWAASIAGRGARKHRALAKVAVARKLAVRLYLMLREDWTYAQLCRAVMQASPSHSVAASSNRPLE